MKTLLLVGVLTFISWLPAIKADTPANCTFEDVRGTWIFYETERNDSLSTDRKSNCTGAGPFVKKIKVDLQYPNIALDEFGNLGLWTIIYNQGFEVSVSGRRFFTFFQYQEVADNVTSFCDTGVPGWSHDVLGHNWACFMAKKKVKVEPKSYRLPLWSKNLEEIHHTDHDYIKHINTVQNSWTARHYPQFDGLSYEDLLRRMGGRRSRILGRPKPAIVTEEVARQARALPDSFDWRNVGGVNFVTPIRDQENCGSCYAFAALAMLEARVKIMTNNSVTQVFSPQDVIGCSVYSQGCEGGFAYLAAGKYGQDFGVVLEECNRYRGVDETCSTASRCGRYYTVRYSYVGGYYGGGNEDLLRLALVHNGPIAVGFEVYSDFMHYSGGVYHHVARPDNVGFEPFELTNHAVLIVGYGTEPTTGEKFWIIKNSWGESWGVKGYFYIRRGTDECGIESIGSEAFPIP